jgi:hypothetical protein
VSAPYPVDHLGDQPLDYADARRRVHQLSQARRDTERKLGEAIKDAAEKEGVYRSTLATEIVKAKTEHGATVGVEVAKGSKSVVDARIDRDIASGVVDGYKERLRLHDQDRASLHRLIEWSMRVNPDGGWPVEYDPMTGEVIGRRAR